MVASQIDATICVFIGIFDNSAINFLYLCVAKNA